MLKRIFLFMMVNLLVVLTISITLSVLGVRGYMTRYGIDYSALAIFCLVWGMGGSLISLALSRWMAKMSMGVEVIDPNTRDPDLQDLVQMVYHLSRSAGLPQMPEVGIYDSPEMNAFATGPSASRSLVAVSTGIMSRMSRDELEAVLGHEISHVGNGDMVTMTLLQGVVNAFVMFLSRILAFAIDQAMNSKDEERRGPTMLQYILIPIFDILFTLLGMLVIARFSRWREFRADAGGARLAGRDKMIAALRALQRNYEVDTQDNTPASIRAFQISGKKSFFELISSHPPLEERIEALEQMRG